LLAGLLLGVPVVAQPPGGSEEPAPTTPGGNWKVLLPTFRDGGNQPAWLIHIESKGGMWSAKVLATGKSAAGRPWPKVELEKLTVGAETLRFTLKSASLTLPCEFRLLRGAEKLRGESRFRGEAQPVELERTTITTLEQFDLARDALARLPAGVNAVMLAQSMLEVAEQEKVSAAEARSWADRAVKTADLYGPGYQRDTIVNIADILVRQKGYEAISLSFAQRAERLLSGKEPPVEQKRVLEVLAQALEKSGKEQEAKAVQARVAKLDFRVKVKNYAGRKGKSDRVVLLELFTNAGCKPNIATDQAIEALSRTFKSGELVVMSYHLNQPEPDPLACADTEGRMDYYELKGLPMVLLDGRAINVVPGEASEAQSAYDDYAEAVERQLEKPADVNLTVDAAKKGSKISITAEAAKLNRPSMEGIRLRVALVEEQVAYKGGNGLATHQNVIRTVPEPKGVEFKDKAAKLTTSVDLADLRKKHLDFLEQAAKKRPYPSKEQPLELKKLRVVAFVQDDKTNEVLQTAVVEVKGD
jgi:hypothetical protein